MDIDKFIEDLDMHLLGKCRLVRVVVDKSYQITVTVEKGDNLKEIENYIKEFCATINQTDIPKIIIEEGAPLKDLVGNIEEHPPINTKLTTPIMGGDKCGNLLNTGYYGTLSFVAMTITLQVRGRPCSFDCTASPGLMSCNHVIGRSDAGQAGEFLWARNINDFGALQCLVPFRCKSSTDVATGTVRDLNLAQRGTIISIGQLANQFRRPNIGERVRKYGARTGLRSGTITHKGTAHVGGHDYYGVFYVSGGFGCPGDSGSSVVSDEQINLGILSWAESISCEQNPYTIFWPLVDPGTKINKAILNITF